MSALVPALIAWFVAQVSKTIILSIKAKKFRLAAMTASGGMPSSHSAMVVALSTSVGLTEGWASVAFAICVVFAFVVIYDAFNVRRSVGLQGMRINQMMDEWDDFENLDWDKLRVTLGHTPLEVAAGIALGLLCGFFCPSITF